MAPFHYAFLVNDIESTRAFYGAVLGCREGRSAETWIDFDFFGNQISAHTSGAVVPPQNTGRVGDKIVPMPHFGAVVTLEEFDSIADRVRKAGIAFVLEPQTRYPGQAGEQRTMFFMDPSGNAIEMKAFARDDEVFDT